MHSSGTESDNTGLQSNSHVDSINQGDSDPNSIPVAMMSHLLTVSLLLTTTQSHTVSVSLPVNVSHPVLVSLPVKVSHPVSVSLPVKVSSLILVNLQQPVELSRLVSVLRLVLWKCIQPQVRRF